MDEIGKSEIMWTKPNHFRTEKKPNCLIMFWGKFELDNFSFPINYPHINKMVTPQCSVYPANSMLGQMGIRDMSFVMRQGADGELQGKNTLREGEPRKRRVGRGGGAEK